MRADKEYPDRLVRSVGEPLIAAAREQPKDVRAGQAQLDDLAAVLAGQPAPSRLARVRAPHPLPGAGHHYVAAPVTSTELARRASR